MHWSDRNDFVEAFRKEFPPEWQAIPFIEYVGRKNTVETTVYFMYDGVSIRSDWEVAMELLESDDIDVGKLVKLMKAQVQFEIDNGGVAEIIAKSKEKNVEEV